MVFLEKVKLGGKIFCKRFFQEIINVFGGREGLESLEEIYGSLCQSSIKTEQTSRCFSLTIMGHKNSKQRKSASDNLDNPGEKRKLKNQNQISENIELKDRKIPKQVMYNVVCRENVTFRILRMLAETL